MNYIYLLADTANFTELAIVMQKAVQVPGIDKSVLAYEYAKCFETKTDWKKARHYFKQAIKLAQNDEVIAASKEAIKRIRLKRWYSFW